MKKFLETNISLELLTSLFSQAPVGLAILMGETHIIANANTQVLEYWGKGDHVIGMPVLEALPEIADQEFPAFLKEVFEKAFWISFVLAIIGWILIYLIWGEFTTSDIIGMLVAVPVIAYLIHVLMLFNKKD